MIDLINIPVSVKLENSSISSNLQISDELQVVENEEFLAFITMDQPLQQDMPEKIESIIIDKDEVNEGDILPILSFQFQPIEEKVVQIPELTESNSIVSAPRISMDQIHGSLKMENESLPVSLPEQVKLHDSEFEKLPVNKLSTRINNFVNDNLVDAKKLTVNNTLSQDIVIDHNENPIDSSNRSLQHIEPLLDKKPLTTLETKTLYPDISTTDKTYDVMIENAINHLEDKKRFFDNEPLKNKSFDNIQRVTTDNALIKESSFNIELKSEESIQSKSPIDSTIVTDTVQIPLVNDTKSVSPKLNLPDVTTGLFSKMNIDLPVQDTAWREAFNEKVLLITHSNLKEATIQLNPAELGPIDISLNLTQDKVDIAFYVQPEIKEIIKEALPSLKELMGSIGLSLTDADIHDHSRGLLRDEQREERYTDQGFSEIESEKSPNSAIILTKKTSAIDYYA